MKEDKNGYYKSLKLMQHNALIKIITENIMLILFTIFLSIIFLIPLIIVEIYRKLKNELL